MIAYFNSSKIFYEVYGKGKPLVLLHGFLESSNMWETILPLLTQENKVICIDLPGHGKSDFIAETHTMELMAEVVYSILDSLEIKHARFLGHSMGGYVSLAFAELFPDEVDTLVLLNSTTESDSEERKKNRDRAIRLIKKDSRLFITMAINNLFYDKTKHLHAREIKQLKEEAFLFPVEGIIATIKGMRDRKGRTEILKNFKGTKFLIAGKEDTMIPKEVSKRISKNANTDVHFVNSGHMTVNENSREMIKILHFIDFL